jgi:hypothetical protein
MVEKKRSLASILGWLFAWTLIYAANLIVPLMFAKEVTRDGGQIGMFAAVGMYWVLGLAGCVGYRRVAPVLVIGGGVIAATQVWPFLHMIVGLISLLICSMPLDSGLGKPILGELKIFAVTILTGGQLLAVAALCGYVIMGVVRAGREARDGSQRSGDRHETSFYDRSRQIGQNP